MKFTGLMRKLLCALLVLAMLISPVAAATTDMDMSISQGCHTIYGQKSLHSADPRLAKAHSAILYDINNDVILYADNPDGQ